MNEWIDRWMMMMMMIAMKVVSSVYMVITLQFYQPTVEKLLHTQSSLPCQIDER